VRKSADVLMQRASHSDGGGGGRRPVLVWRFEPEVLAVSTAVLGGGIGMRSWAINAEVTDEYHRSDPAAHTAEIGAELGLAAGRGVGMVTAARVLDVVATSDGGASCDATVGLSVPTWAASADGAEAEWRPGTINLACHVPAPLGDAALVNAIVTVTEAKTQALLELGVAGTGTASDAVLVTCPPSAKGAEAYGGPRSEWGARLARAVHQAVLEGATRYLAGRG
jgi:adenosylcobinamide hydrolase